MREKSWGKHENQATSFQFSGCLYNHFYCECDRQFTLELYFSRDDRYRVGDVFPFRDYPGYRPNLDSGEGEIAGRRCSAPA